MVGLKEQISFGRCLDKCMDQAIARNHHQVLQRISHHHLHILIKIKKSNQVFKRRNKFCESGKTGWSGFGRTKNDLYEEDDCSTSSSDIDDDDDIDDEYDEPKLLVEFKKYISKHMKLQKRHEISYILIKNLWTHMHC
jgi:hypothetical protein